MCSKIIEASVLFYFNLVFCFFIASIPQFGLFTFPVYKFKKFLRKIIFIGPKISCRLFIFHSTIRFLRSQKNLKKTGVMYTCIHIPTCMRMYTHVRTCISMCVYTYIRLYPICLFVFYFALYLKS